MIIPRWSKVNRKRQIQISYKDPNFVRYYDLDLKDFTDIVLKLKKNEDLSVSENYRYGLYIMTMCIIVQEGPKFVMKTKDEKEKMIEVQYYELLTKIHNFDPALGSIYSYSYKIAWNAGIHYFKELIKNDKKEKRIQAHLDACTMDYNSEITSGKKYRGRNPDELVWSSIQMEIKQ